MELGIIGFWYSGKSTIFDALCGGRYEVLRHSDEACQVHLAALKIQDTRADSLAEKFKPKKTTRAVLKVSDVVGPAATYEQAGAPHKGSLLESQVQHLATSDAWLGAIRAFAASDLPAHDARKEISNIVMELIFSDLAKIENRLPGIEKSLKKVSGQEKEHLLAEQEVLLKAKTVLDQERPLTDMEINDQDMKLIRGFQFASMKPILFLINTDKEDTTEVEGLCTQLKAEFDSPYFDFLPLNAEIEKEILELSPEDREDFLEDYHIKVLARERIIDRVLHLLNLISFYTINPNELHVWLIRQNTPALDAAGMVHSDFARGFIRAETLSWKELIDAEGFSHARREGTVRAEGKHYLVKDGEVINFLFNV